MTAEKTPMETLTITPNDELLMLDVPIALREPTVKELYLVQYPNKIGEDAWTENVLVNDNHTAHLVAFEHQGSKVWKVKRVTLEAELVAE